jgi:hypothetical protein
VYTLENIVICLEEVIDCSFEVVFPVNVGGNAFVIEDKLEVSCGIGVVIGVGLRAQV